jgi:uncharacterized membrane protein
MTNLMAAACLFLGIHLVVSGTRVRDVITGAIGEKLYLPLFALTSLGAIVWLCSAYNRASVCAANRLLFDAGQGFRDAGVGVMAIAFALLIPGLLRRSPTAVGQSGAQLSGVLRVTRHPFLCAVALWSAFHLIGTGTSAGMIFFGTFLVVAAIGTKAIDGKIRRKRPQEWQKIAAETSILPFGAIFAGRNRFVAREYFDWRFGAAVAAFAGMLAIHTWLFGISPFPNGWVPF